MKTQITLCLIAALSCPMFAADLTLDACYEKARQNHPLQKEKRHRQQVYELNRKNLAVQWLPSLHVNGSAVFNSDVAAFDDMFDNLTFPLPAESMPAMPKEQYKLSMDVNQLLFDGGAVHAARQAEKAALQADLQSLETEFYKIREQINPVYFASLMLQKQTELAQIYQEELLEQRAALESGVENGMILPTNLDILDAEGLQIEQQLIELTIQQKSMKSILGELIGESIAEADLILPKAADPGGLPLQRPELVLFDKQKCLFEKNKHLVQSEQFPKAAAFASYGYGQPPGSNFFHDEFDTYYTVGVTLSWNLFNWNITGREKQKLQARQSIVDARKDNFIRQIRIALNKNEAEMNRLQALLQSDKKLMALRRNIKEAAASKLKNGTISSTEFLTELNAERDACLRYEMHQIQYAQAKVDYQTLSGQNRKGEQ